MEKECDFSAQGLSDEDIKREKLREDMLHNILQGPLLSKKEKGVTFPDVWFC